MAILTQMILRFLTPRFLCLLFFPVFGMSQEKPAEPAKTKPAVKRIGETRFRLGQVEFDSKTKELFIPATVNMREGGPIEYVLVHENGKVHESILTTSASPLDIQIALNLLSYKAGIGDVFDKLLSEEALDQAGKKEDRGDGLHIFFQWKEGDEEKSSPIDTLVIDGEDTEPMPVGPWIFTGSTTEGGTYMAEAEGSILAVYLDHLAIFNMARPGSEIDERWGANGDLIPETGIKGTVVLKKMH